MTGHRRRILIVVAALALLVPSFGAAASGAQFPAGPPDDPDYAPAESTAPGTCLTRSVLDEEHGLYGSMPRCAPGAHDPEHASGMSVDKVWRHYTTGSPKVTVAYVEGGINWHSDDARDLVNKVFLNTGELPKPAGSAAYDRNGDGVVNVADYAGDPRAHDANGNGYLDPEDLIAAFSDGRDDDGNGFPDDISGWDFYEHQNDPATHDATYGHANAQMRRAAAQTDNHLLGAGICPKCRILPVRAGQEALDRTADLAQAWLYAGQMGAKVIVSTTADLGYSTYMRQAVNKLWRDGVVMVESSNDFDSTDHQGGMFWPHVLPGNGLVANSQGVPTAAANALTTTYRARSNLTSYGTKAMFSVATQGGSTSESTPTTGGIAALLISAGLKLGRPVTNAEVIQLLRATAGDIDDPALPWPGRPGWDTQYGYGRPNVYKAVKALAKGDVPPVAWLSSPDWYALFDPATTHTVPVTGHVAAPRSGRYHWKLQYGLGPEPDTFHTVGSGSGTHPFDGRLGGLDLSRIPKSFWDGAYKLSDDKELSATQRYTVTLRLRVWDADGRMGAERRAVAVHHDPSLATGFPRRMGTAGESQPALADLGGTGHPAIIYGDDDGRVHALDPRTRRELPGWPVTTDALRPRRSYGGVTPGHEPIIASVAAGDLTGDGRPEVVATSMAGHTYAWAADGRLLPGWPKTLNTGVRRVPIPRPALNYTRLPQQGATANPVIVDLNGDHRGDVVQAGWDGRLHAWDARGRDLPGWPVEVRMPDGYRPPSGKVLINDHKLDAAPAVADLDGDGKPELVVRSQYTETPGAGIQLGGANYVFAYHSDGTPVDGWPAKVGSLITYYGSAQEFITEAAGSPAAADVDGDGKDEVATGPSFGSTALLRGDGTTMRVYGPQVNVAAPLVRRTYPARKAIRGALPVDAPVGFTTSGAFGTVGGRLGYFESGSGAVSLAGALLFPGSGSAIKNFERGYDARTGLPSGGYPQTEQGLDFLGAPVIADVTGDGRPEVMDGGDSSALHAFTPDGQAAGFPKFTPGWLVFSPSAGDLYGDGHTDLVATTREGYLMVWKTPGHGGVQWPAYRHDARRTGRYTGTAPAR